MHDQPKLCECGCGQPAPIATRNDAKKGYVRGKPRRFVQGHHTRVMAPEVRQRIGESHRGMKRPPETGKRISIALGGTGDANPSAVHVWLIRHHPKTGVCEECGTAGRTDYAFLRHPEPHTRDRGDYRELCPRCHRRFDGWWPRRNAPHPQA